MLRPGDRAPDFTAQDQHGRTVGLADWRGKHVVLYFYPADDTPGCTVESCGFRDAVPELEAAGAVVVGVSTQGVRSHRAFAERHGLPFTLVADPDKRVCRMYEALGLLGVAKRVTYLIGPDGRVLRAWSRVRPREHAREVLESLAKPQA